MLSALKGVKCWLWANTTVLSHLNPMNLLCLVMISSSSTLSYFYFIFSSFFWRKQKINGFKSGLYKPSLKLMSISTAEGQMRKQEVHTGGVTWSGLPGTDTEGWLSGMPGIPSGLPGWSLTWSIWMCCCSVLFIAPLQRHGVCQHLQS